ncbi:hypothetical protein [Spirillospora sp. NPDC047279]|uniref:hypothetical protein n=1 Tax=Spirillospora sp. NPDC047279 TaxID=3155478 RepID=UPI0033EEFABD
MGPEWWSIEVFDAEVSAARWRDAHQELLVESALTNGAVDWHWHAHSWGVVFEIAFTDEDHWTTWRALPGTRAALDAVPDPVNGLVVYRGRGGSSGTPVPRRPRPAPGAAALELEPPPDETPLGLLDIGSAPPGAPPEGVPMAG